MTCCLSCWEGRLVVIFFFLFAFLQMLFYRFASFWLYCGEWRPLLIFIYHRDALRRLCWVDGCILIHSRYDLFQSVPTLWFGPEQSWTSQHGPCTRVLLWLLLRAHCQSSARVKVGRLCVRVYCKKTSFSPLRDCCARGACTWATVSAEGFKVEEDLWLISVCFRCLPYCWVSWL